MRDWAWAVIYDDGSEVTEEQAKGFGMLEIGRIRLLTVHDRRDPKVKFAVHITEGLRPIFFRRKKMLSISDPSSIPPEYLDESGNVCTSITYATVLGWQKTVNGKNVKSMTWLMYDGSVVVSDRDIDDL